MPGKGLRKGLRNELRQCLLSKTAHARRAVREPRAMVIGSCLPMGGHPFFEQFFGALFSPKPAIFDETCVQNGTQNEVFWGLLFKESAKIEKCVWTAPACTDCI